jgi:hypothetical protein
MPETVVTDTEQNVPPYLAVALLRAFEHRHEVVHLVYTADNETDAVRRIASLLEVDEHTATAVLNAPIRQMLPEERASFETER